MKTSSLEREVRWNIHWFSHLASSCSHGNDFYCRTHWVHQLHKAQKHVSLFHNAAAIRLSTQTWATAWRSPLCWHQTPLMRSPCVEMVWTAAGVVRWQQYPAQTVEVVLVWSESYRWRKRQVNMSVFVLCTVCLYTCLSCCLYTQISPCGTIKGLFCSKFKFNSKIKTQQQCNIFYCSHEKACQLQNNACYHSPPQHNSK